MNNKEKTPEQPVGLPERDKTKPAEEQGLFRKFDVRRTDGSGEPGGKHHGCEYFVLDVDHDRHAKAALNAYVLSCQLSHPELAKDMAARYGLKPYDRIDRLAEALKELDELKAPMRESVDNHALKKLINDFRALPYSKDCPKFIVDMWHYGNNVITELEKAIKSSERESGVRQAIECVQAINSEGWEPWRIERLNAALAWLQTIEQGRRG